MDSPSLQIVILFDIIEALFHSIGERGGIVVDSKSRGPGFNPHWYNSQYYWLKPRHPNMTEKYLTGTLNLNLNTQIILLFSYVPFKVYGHGPTYWDF